MTSRHFRLRKWTACLLAIGLLAAVTPSAFAQQKQYVTTTIRGTLTETKGAPVAGAILRFTPTDPQASVVEAMTDASGAFEAPGLIFTSYAIEIETADGEIIKGLNDLPIREADTTEILLTVSPRVVSQTSLTNDPQRFVAAVSKRPKKWKRFWKQFGIFVGATAVVGAVAED